MAKKGVALYKEIKATAGDVSGVIKDLKDQYHKIAAPSQEQKKQYNEEVRRVQEIAATPASQALNTIWDHLGTFVDQYDVMSKAYIASEIASRQVYKGEQSLARRALERLRVKHQLDSMLIEVREEMVYNTPPELGDLWTRYEKMWTQIVQEQNVALAAEVRKTQIIIWRRNQAINHLKAMGVWIGAVLFVVAWMWGIMGLIRTSQTYRSLSFYVLQ